MPLWSHSTKVLKRTESEDLAPTNPGGLKALRLPHGSATDCSIYQRDWTFEKKKKKISKTTLKRFIARI